MAEAKTANRSIELVPRRVFFHGVGAVGALFVLPACGGAAPEPAKDASTQEAAAAPPAPAAAASIAPNSAWEAEAKTLESGGQGLYTAKDPKDQPGKEGTHVPKVALSGDKVALTTTHASEAPSDKKPKGHYITHHYLRDGASGTIFAWKTFELKPGESAASEFTLPAGVTSFTAYQVCNLHWAWAAEPQAKS